MRTTLLYMIMCALLSLSVTSCHKDYNDYTTTAHIALTLPIDGKIETIQYSVKMVDLNSRNTVTQAGETRGTIDIENLFRGAYSIHVEGVVRYVDSDSIAHTSQFRALSDYVSLVGLDDNVVSLEMILMD